MSDGQIRMTAEEYREAMGLDPVESKTKVTVRHEKQPPLGDKFAKGVDRLVLRTLWLAGWVWMIFTFGWLGHVIVRLTERRLNANT